MSDRGGDTRIFEAVAHQAACSPDAVAVRSAGSALTYAQLDARARRLAEVLRGLGVGPEAPVGIAVRRSSDLLVALLAVVRAGGCFVPLDPSYPAARLQYMIETTRMSLLLSESGLRDTLPPSQARVLCLDEPWPAPASRASAPRVRADQLAYIIFTSGSTGRPKGVQVSHRALMNLLRSARESPSLTPSDVVLATVTICFDISIFELFLPLLCGATVVLASDREAADPQRLTALLREERITLLQATPVTWRMLLEHGFEVPRGFRAFCGGEALPGTLAAELVAKGIPLYNWYGPTEAAIWATVREVSPRDADAAVVSIGAPIDGMEVHILDDDLQPLAPGEPGELFLGGVGLARGYYGQPGLTAERFIPKPTALGGRPGERIYRTGDIARYARVSDGEGAHVEYLGRADRQVKLRGYRIELDEIRHVLLQHEDVKQAVVTVFQPPTGGEPRLVAYVVPEQGEAGGHAPPAREQIDQWRRVWDTTYADAATDGPPDLNIVGWQNRYTNLPIPLDHMRQWVDATVARILRDAGPRVLEIGFGTGMILLRVAPHCTSYVGTDLSPEAVGAVSELLAGRPDLAHVRLIEAPADGLDALPPDVERFDTVILNSVVQYFPSLAYLLQVIEGALSRTRPGGTLFLGDIRNGALLETLHAAVQLFRAEGTLSVADLERAIERQRAQEQELVIDPEFFYQLSRRFPRISRVEMHLKRGRHQDAVTQFRYDVILHLDASIPAGTATPWRDWSAGPRDLPELRALLERERPARAGFANVPNARVAGEHALVQRLAAADCPGELSALRATVTRAGGLHPEDLWSLGDALGYEVEIRWAREQPAAMDVVFTDRGAVQPGPMAARAVDARPLAAYGNNPLRGKVAAWMEPRLRTQCAAFLPDYMRPSTYVVLDALPLTFNGKVDVGSLPAPGTSRPNLGTALVRPQSDTERRLAALWAKVLQLEAVGVHDNFMELGGTSILLTQIHDELVSSYGSGLTIVDMFRFPTVHTLAGHLEGLGKDSRAPSIDRPRSRRSSGPEAAVGGHSAAAPGVRSGDIAIIGMSCRFPGADSPAQFWTNLVQGVESISFFEPSEADIVDPTLASSPGYVRAAAIVEGVEDFDAGFFGYSEREAALMDPQQRLFLECAWEALEDAGYAADRCDWLVGVFAGAGMNTYLINNIHPSQRWSPNRSFLSTAHDLQIRLGNDKDHIATRVSYKLNLRGPSVVVQTACSTSLVAVHAACQSILSGECDMAIAGCMNLILPQKAGYVYEENMMFSPDGRCRAFDADAQGTLFGSGGAAVVLKRLSEALADGDDVYAVIKGSAVNNDGALKVGYTAPTVEGQAAVIHEAMAAADVDADTITYVEAHGTGTALGDPIEVAGLTRAWQVNLAERRGWAPEDGYGGYRCVLGSVKTNLGHLTESAGVAGLIKAALALRHRALPATLHFRRPNPRIDFAAGPFYVSGTLQSWEQPQALAERGLPRRAGVSSFGMGGTNAHVVLEEAPRRAPRSPRGGPRLLVLSAKTRAGLDAQVARARGALAVDPGIDLDSFCFTYATGRQHFDVRAAFVADDRAELLAQLGALLTPGARLPVGVTLGPTGGHSPAAQRSAGRPRKVGFLFTGQGSQYPGMGRELYRDWPVFRGVLDDCAAILERHLDRPLLTLLFDPEAEAGLLSQTQYTQPAVFSIQVALARLWETLGVTPDVVMGHSAGELAAACVAGVLPLEDALALVAARGRLMASLPPGGAMAAVSAAPDRVAELLGEHGDDIAVAAFNGPDHTVISGRRAAVDAVCGTLQAEGARTRMLDVSHAFHSPLMRPMVAGLRERLRGLHARRARLPIVSNVTGRMAGAELGSPDYWCRHILEPVRFADSCQTLADAGADTLIEIGPKPVLLGMATGIFDDTAPVLLPSLTPTVPDSRRMLASLASGYVHGLPVDLPALFEQRFPEEPPVRLHLPPYAFQRTRNWIEPAAQDGKESRAPVAVTADPPSSPPQGAEGVGPPSLLEQIQAAPLRNRRRLLTEEILHIVADLLGQSSGSVLDPAHGFFESGMDSLTSILLRNRLQVALACNLPRTIAFTCPSVAALVDHLAEKVLPISIDPQLSHGASPPAEVEALSDALLEQLTAMSDADAEALLLAQLEEFQGDEAEHRRAGSVVPGQAGSPAAQAYAGPPPGRRGQET